MGAPQSKLQQPVENLYDAIAPSNKTAEVDLLIAGLRTLLSRSITRCISLAHTQPIPCIGKIDRQVQLVCLYSD